MMELANRFAIIAALTVCGSVTLLIAGSSPAVEPIEGSPLPPSTNVVAPARSDSSGLQTGPQASQGAPGSAGNYSSGATGTTERGVAGSGRPREKVSEVNAKALTTSKTDGKFSGSLLDLGLKHDEKSTNNNVHEGKEQKPVPTQAGEKSSSPAPAKAVSATKTDGNH
jgi:hypothetical protein